MGHKTNCARCARLLEKEIVYRVSYVYMAGVK